ncbi:MAG: MqnA/MqnD/SBP family protein [Chloroflexia bacterium]
MPDRTILTPISWLLDSGWLEQDVAVYRVRDDAEAVEAVLGGRASAAFIDPLVWARSRSRLRPVLRHALAIGPGGSDLLLLSDVRLDNLESVSGPTEIVGTNEEAAARTLVRDYYGVPQPLALDDDSAPKGAHGVVIAGDKAMRAHNYPYVESLARAWWVATGGPWVRALAVLAANNEDDAPELVLRAASKLLAEESDSIAAQAARRSGGDEERWRTVVRALSLTYGADERRSLAASFASAARLRLCPPVEEVLLPRY